MFVLCLLCSVALWYSTGHGGGAGEEICTVQALISVVIMQSDSWIYSCGITVNIWGAINVDGIDDCSVLPSHCAALPVCTSLVLTCASACTPFHS